MILRILSIVAAVVMTILSVSLVENITTSIGYGSVKDMIFIAQNKWASYACGIIYFILFLFFVAVFLVLSEFVGDFIESRKNTSDVKEETSFSEKEMEEEQSDKKYDKIAKAALIAIPIITIFIFLVSVYVFTFNTTVFTKITIIEKSPFNPSGTEYSYSDITKIDNKDDSNLFLDLHIKNGDTVTVDYSGGTDSNNEKYADYPEAFIRDFLNNSRNKNIPITFNCTYEDVTEYNFNDEPLTYMKEIFEGNK